MAFVKILITVFIALATLILFRQFSERNKQARVRIKPKNAQNKKAENLFWDKKTQSYRPED